MAGSLRKRPRYALSASTSEDDGVMGYQVTTVTPPNIAPSAPAELPSIRILPRVTSIRSRRNGSRFTRLARAHSHPARTA